MISRTPRLTPREQAAQMICAAFRFEAPEFEQITDLVKQGLGGVCLFGGSIFETAPFVNSLQKLAKLPLLVASDYEKGAAHQVKGATLLPTAMALGATGSEELAELAGKVTAREARALGVNWILAPVLDLQTRAENPIINIRSFGSDPALVVKLGRAFCRGIHTGGALTCGKHFPGHGDVTVDSHVALPKLADYKSHVKPFQDLAADLDSIMSAHLLVESLDAKLPVSLSAKGIKAARDFGFEGLIVTDALMMGAITAGYPDAQAVVLAAKAGNDVILYPADPAGAIDALEKAIESGEVDPDRSIERILAAKAGFKDRIVEPETTERVVGCDMHLDAARKIAEASVTRLRGKSPIGKVRVAVATDDPRVTLEIFRGGLDVAPDAETGILALCSHPRAFVGAIGLPDAVIAAARKELGDVKRIVAVSFGSPYVHSQVKSDDAICVYDESEASQRAAARAIAGKIPMNGRLPVIL